MSVGTTDKVQEALRFYKASEVNETRQALFNSKLWVSVARQYRNGEVQEEE
jgi:hypothetical protein